MARRIQAGAGVRGLDVGDGLIISSGETAVVSDAEFADLAEAVSAGAVIDLGATTEPESVGHGSDRVAAADVPYDNTESGLTGSTVQEAVDELAGGGGPRGVYKTADQTVPAGTTTLQNDTHLGVPIEAGETLHVIFELFVSSPEASGDFKANVEVPAGATVRWTSIMGPGLSATNTESMNKNQSYPGSSELSAGVPPTTISDAFIRYTATVENGATTGEVRLQWAKNAAGTAGTTVKAGSVAFGYSVS